MKKLITTMLVTLMMSCLCVPVQAANNLQSFQNVNSLMIVQAQADDEPSYEYEDGYETGWQDGWKDGYQVGEDSGYKEGFQAGEESGYKEGCESGYNAGVDSTIGFFVEYYELDEGIEESLRANEYWRKTINEEGANVNSDYAKFYTEEFPEYPAQ